MTDVISGNSLPESYSYEKLMGDPDGPERYIDNIDRVVLTFIDPRLDLVVSKPGAFQRLDYHVPFKFRGGYKPEMLPDKYVESLGRDGIVIETDSQGFAICGGNLKRDGSRCRNAAVNRTRWCRNHGGALHPADKKLSTENTALPFLTEISRVAKLDRPERFMQGFMDVTDLSDDELIQGFILNDEGKPVTTLRLSAKLLGKMTEELHKRMNRFMTMKLPKMIAVVSDLAESDFVEPADRIKAASIIIDRTMGKTPEVLMIGGAADAPYQGIFESIDSGSRADYRKSVESARGEGKELEYAEVVDLPDVDDGESEPTWEDDSEPVESSESEVEDSGLLRGRVEQPVRNLRTQVENEQERASDLHGENPHVGNDGVVDTGETHNVEDIARGKREAVAATRERIKKAKARRFAARASGAVSAEDLEYVISWKKKLKRDGGGWRGTLVCLGELSETALARIKNSSLNS